MNDGIEIGETPPRAYDSKDFKRLEYENMESNVNLKYQYLDERKERQRIGRVIATLAALIPILILLFLAYLLICQESVINQMGDVSQAVIISASLLCFTIIYTVLIKGMFGNTQEKEIQPSAREAVELIKEHHQSNNG